MHVLIAFLVTACMAAVDFCHARYTRAMLDGRVIQAAFWSVGQWGSASVGFVVAVKVSIWYLPFEALGLFLGTLLGGSRVKKVNVPKAKARYVQRRGQSEMPSVPESCSCNRGNCEG